MSRFGYRVSALALALLAAAIPAPTRADARPDRVAELQAEFEAYAGARLVFEREQLPPGTYHDVMPPLDPRRRVRAASIALAEAKKFPPGYLGDIGLDVVGIFESCVSKLGDGYREYEDELGGYRYYGIWNGRDAVAAAYYTDDQLPLTLHHEWFHHVDATVAGRTSYDPNFAADDDRFTRAVSGDEPYPGARIAAGDLAALRRHRDGYWLRDAVGHYSRKGAGEDQAETARYVMTALPDALVQVAEHPELAGSQRILHVLAAYRGALVAGPDLDWFVDVALGRPRAAPDPTERLVTLLERSARGGVDEAKTRELLGEAERAVAAGVSRTVARRLLTASAAATHRLMRARIHPQAAEPAFQVWGREDRNGVNRTLRADIARFGADALVLRRIGDSLGDGDPLVAVTQLHSLQLLGAYYEYIEARWRITPGTRAAFDDARLAMLRGLPASRVALARALAGVPVDRVRELLPDARLRVSNVTDDVIAAAAGAGHRINRYIDNVDAEIADRARRAAIRRVQAATVRLDNGSGVNIAADGKILTAAHVAKQQGARMHATFPDGTRYEAVCVAIDPRLDLAVLDIEASVELPVAAIAAAPPRHGAWVAIIGQPGRWTPDGDPTGYQPFHVSTGQIRGFLGDRLGDQSLGRTKHDAWTYWGHSGSPLFDDRGHVIAMHNSWDSTTAMRHAVTHEAIVHFLSQAHIGYQTAR